MTSEVSSAISGGCLCGAVRYASSAAPLIEGNCHCRDCQKASGSAYAPTLFFPLEAVTITGDAKFFESIGGSGQPIRRGFCPKCGSQLFGLPSMSEDIIGVRAGSLDDTSAYHPQAEIFTSHAAHWDSMSEATAKFETYPPMS